MKKRFIFVVLIYASFLCACTRGVPQQSTIPQIVGETYAETVIPTTAETETVPATSETNTLLHSQLYHPDYTLQQILEYFEEVVLDVEYSDGTGDSSLVQKWTEPILYRFFGSPTQEDLEVLNRFVEQLNELPGFPGMYPARERELEHIRISFLEPDLFRDSFSSVVNGEDAFGATEFWYYTNTNNIYSARIGYRTDISQSTRNSVLLEEIVNTLGVSDTLLRKDSITYQYSNENIVLSNVDWILLKLLYHPDIHCGMDSESCAAVIERLYY